MALKDITEEQIKSKINRYIPHLLKYHEIYVVVLPTLTGDGIRWALSVIELKKDNKTTHIRSNHDDGMYPSYDDALLDGVFNTIKQLI